MVSVILTSGSVQKGFIPNSQIPKDLNPRSLQLGKEVKVRFLTFQPGKLTLSMLDKDGRGQKREETNWNHQDSRKPGKLVNLKVFQEVAPGKWLLGRVAHAAQVGYFVTLEADGLQTDALLRHANTAGSLS